MEYESVIGLEVHIHLNTRTKAFCSCGTEFGLAANTQVCPVCLGFPGTLPVFNEVFLEYAIRAGLALNCKIANYIKFDRKNYFYPDLPKGYQITQFDFPIGACGYLNIALSKGENKRIGVTRVHMEEDAGKLVHTNRATLVDFNRGGIPLLEIVSEPDLNSAQQAYTYLSSLKSIIEYLEISDCDMEKGSLRCDANISLRLKGTQKLGVKVELKNMNSFKNVRTALNYEITRQKEQLDTGKKIVQQTRLWDADKQKTVVMREKEDAHDYRYFPEPDLVPFTISNELIEQISSNLPELPAAKKQRLIEQYKLSEYDAGVISADKHLALYFEAVVSVYFEPKVVANWLMGSIMNYLNTHQSDAIKLQDLLPAERLVSLLKVVAKGVISVKIAKEILPEVISSNKDAEAIIKEKKLCQISDPSELESIIDEIINANANVVQDFKDGKTNALMFFVGQVMKKTRGKANPQVVNTMLKNKLIVSDA
ncbi:MAG: Asp-tRNA(Asn)/Glu-tRNA(Gln) amidotransferase GatCAB subunit B [Candidatus Omnitrophota bacterium]|nr:MAG: Asp-tRNA(Asn)/Glu-tRNA(Gln) amidotransferase GatCAB subunit B [Candidatus Omnitrophota bacterium]